MKTQQIGFQAGLQGHKGSVTESTTEKVLLQALTDQISQGTGTQTKATFA